MNFTTIKECHKKVLGFKNMQITRYKHRLSPVKKFNYNGPTLFIPCEKIQLQRTNTVYPL